MVKDKDKHFVLKMKVIIFVRLINKTTPMLKKIRVAFAVLFWAGITLLLLDFTGLLHHWLGWMTKVQFLPAVMAANFAVIAGLVLLTLLFGRVYCSVICPLGVFQDGVAHLHHRPRKHRNPYHYKKENRWLRYGVWALFVVLLFAGLQALAAVLAPYSAWGRIVQNLFQPVALWLNNWLAGMAERAGSYAFYERVVWLRSLPTLIIAGLTLVAVVVLAWRGGRDYCNNICPVGTTLGFLSRFSMFRPLIDKDKCKNCKACERACKASCIDLGRHDIDHSRCVTCFDCIDSCRFGALRYGFAWKPVSRKQEPAVDESRRAFLTGTALVIGTAALKAQGKKTDGGLAPIRDKTIPEREVPVTPPGSRSVKDFYRRCTACQLCVAQCPNNVLRPSDRLEHLMQPEMSFERGYCRPECTRCSELCPSGAIRRITKEEKTRYHVGTARVDRDLCVAEQGTSCGNCARHCPVGAITMVENEMGLSVPSVDPAVCIGCGACENLCPSRPVSAITVDGRYDHLND